MAVQSTSSTVDLSASAAADLTTIQDTRVSDGFRAWVSAAGATHGLWVLDKNSVLVPDGVTVVATLSGVGRWLFFGGGGGGGGGAALSVPNEAALTLAGVAGLSEGAVAYVQSHRTYWSLRTQALTLRANELIASADAARQWNRESYAHLSWAMTYSVAAPVVVNPLTGNNENDGLTSGTALLDFNEVARRLPVLVQPLVANYDGTGSPGANGFPSWNPTVRWLRAVSATVPSVAINGVVTAGALPAGATGVLATSTDVVGNVPPRISDTGGAGVVWVRGTMLEATSGASNGARSFVMNNEGGGLAAVGVWRNAAGTANVTPPAPGDTYRVVTLTQLTDVFVAGPVLVTFKNFQVLAWSQTAQVFGTPSITFNLCSLSPVTFNPTGGTTVNLNSSYYSSSSVFVVSNAVTVLCSGTSFDRTGQAAPMRCTSGGKLSMSNGYLQGDSAVSSGLAVAGPFANDGVAGGESNLSNFGIRGVQASAALAVRKGGVVNVIGTLWGTGNALQGTQVKEGGRMAVLSTVTPTLTGTVQELELQGAAVANPTAGGIPVAAVALINWAQWVAGFARNVMDYKAGSVIADAA